MDPDLSDFYRLNEEVALELQRLEREGHLDGVQRLLRAAGAELHVASARPRDGFEELIGVLRPRRAGEPGPAAARRDLPPEDGQGPEGCSATGQAAQPAKPAGGWDHEGVLAARSRFTVVFPDGEAREVYMPDHVCPACRNDVGNVIDACSRRCGVCAFCW